MTIAATYLGFRFHVLVGLKGKLPSTNLRFLGINTELTCDDCRYLPGFLFLYFHIVLVGLKGKLISTNLRFLGINTELTRNDYRYLPMIEKRKLP